MRWRWKRFKPAERLREEVPTSYDLISFDARSRRHRLPLHRLHRPDPLTSRLGSHKWLTMTSQWNPEDGEPGRDVPRLRLHPRNSCCSWPQSTARIKVHRPGPQKPGGDQCLCMIRSDLNLKLPVHSTLQKAERTHLYLSLNQRICWSQKQWGKTNVVHFYCDIILL